MHLGNKAHHTRLSASNLFIIKVTSEMIRLSDAKAELGTVQSNLQYCANLTQLRWKEGVLFYGLEATRRFSHEAAKLCCRSMA